MAKTRNVSVAVLAGLLLAAGPAKADVTKAQCIDANTKGQELRRDGKLSGAGQQFRTCAAASCPPLLRDDCASRLDEIERVQPTIVFDTKDASGRDVSAVRVTVDGTPLADRLTGAPLPVDPGEHVFTFEVAGQAPVSRTLVIKESERDRRERIALGGASGAAAAPAPSSGPPSASPGDPSSRGAHIRKIVGEGTAGVGAAGLVVGSVFGLMAIMQASQQKTDCASADSCSNRGAALSDHSSATTYGAVSTASFVVGGVLLAAGGILFFTAGRPDQPATTTGLVVAPSVGPGGGAMWLTGAF